MRPQIARIVVSVAVALFVLPAHATTPKIVNGLFTSQYPSVGMLLKGGSAANATLNCSGTMIGCETFLTAGHCVEGDLNPGHYFVFLQHAGFFNVATVTLHPSYGFPVADLAVLTLSTPVTGARPSILNTTMTPAANSPGTIVGFGRSGGAKTDYGLKRYGTVRTATCHDGISNTTSVCWDFLYPLGPAGEDSSTCNGDSGGPLFIDFGAGERLAGVTSGGAEADCLPNDLSYDANVHHYAAWIQSEGGADLANTSCGSLPQAGDAGTTVAAIVGSLASTSSGATHSFKVPSGTVQLRVALNATEQGGSDFDMYVKAGSPASTSSFDCKADSGTQYGFCQFNTPAAGDWYVLVNRFSGSGPYQVTATSFPVDCTDPGNDGLLCNDGNDCTGTDTCVALACVGTPLANGVACDDGSLCTVNDSCQAGSCDGVAPTCKVPFLSGKASLVVRDSTITNARDRLIWKWLAGSSTDKSELGDPTAGTDYALCLHDMGSSPELKMERVIPAGALWTENTPGFRYNDPDRANGGVSFALLKEGADGAAKTIVKAKGENLILPSLPLGENGPVKVRLIGNGNCWESTFSTPRLSNETQYKARAD